MSTNLVVLSILTDSPTFMCASNCDREQIRLIIRIIYNLSAQFMATDWIRPSRSISSAQFSAILRG